MKASSRGFLRVTGATPQDPAPEVMQGQHDRQVDRQVAGREVPGITDGRAEYRIAPDLDHPECDQERGHDAALQSACPSRPEPPRRQRERQVGDWRLLEESDEEGRLACPPADGALRGLYLQRVRQRRSEHHGRGRDPRNDDDHRAEHERFESTPCERARAQRLGGKYEAEEGNALGPYQGSEPGEHARLHGRTMFLIRQRGEHDEREEDRRLESR